nr:hypothetical protein [Tanacetum cinerariifolium]
MINAQVDDLSSHNAKYTSPALTQKVFTNIRRICKGFLGVETPLFDAMLVPLQVQDNVAEVEEDEDEDNKVSSAPTPPLPKPTVGNKIHKAFPLPGIEFPLAEEVPTASEEGCRGQKKREATARNIALLSKSRRTCQSKSNDSFTNLVPHVTPCILGITIIVTSCTRTPCPIKGVL